MPEDKNSHSVIIIGAGIAGLSAGIYAQLNGYQSRIYEMHSLPGGVMTSWKRKGYTIDGCVQWLMGSNPKSNLYPCMKIVGLIENRQFFNPDVFLYFEDSGWPGAYLLCGYRPAGKGTREPWTRGPRLYS